MGAVNSGPMTSATGRWVRPTRPDDDDALVHGCTDGKPICGAWINWKIVDWQFVAHGYDLPSLTCQPCIDIVTNLHLHQTNQTTSKGDSQ